MAHKSKHSKFHLSIAVIIRLIIFALVVFGSINYLSSQNKSPLVLGENTEIKPIFDTFYQMIPSGSQEKINNLSSNQTVIFIQNKINQIKTETNGFPQKQIIEIKKAVVKEIYQNVMKSIDTSSK